MWQWILGESQPKNSTSDDDLARLIWEKYRIHLLRWPREGYNVGLVYSHYHDEKDVRFAGSFENFAGYSIGDSLIEEGEEMANISGTKSQTISSRAGFDFLGTFVNALGAVGLDVNMMGEINSKRVRGLQYQFINTTRDSYDDHYALIRHFRENEIDKESLIIDDNQRYYLCDSVYRSNSLKFGMIDNRDNSVELDLSAMKAGVSSEISIEKAEGNMVTVSSDRRLSYGMTVHEIAYDEADRCIKIVPPRLRNANMTGPTYPYNLPHDALAEIEEEPPAEHAVLISPQDLIFLP